MGFSRDELDSRPGETRLVVQRTTPGLDLREWTVVSSAWPHNGLCHQKEPLASDFIKTPSSLHRLRREELVRPISINQSSPVT